MLSFTLTRITIHALRLNSKKIQGFCLILNQEGLSWLRTYLETGEAEDFGFNPNSVTAYGEGEDKDFQLSIFKQLILAGKSITICSYVS